MCLLAASCIIGGKHGQLTKMTDIFNCISAAQRSQSCSRFGNDFIEMHPAAQGMLHSGMCATTVLLQDFIQLHTLVFTDIIWYNM